MDLKELTPDAIKIELNGIEYQLEYSYLSLRELEVFYGDEDKYGDAVQRIVNILEQKKEDLAKREDLINFLFTGLLQSNIFPSEILDKSRWPWRIEREACKEFLSSVLIAKHTPSYALLIVAAWMNSRITPEMMEIFEIMSSGQKKTEVDATGSTDSFLSRWWSVLKRKNGSG